MATWQGFSDVELQRLKRGAPQRAGDRARRTDSDESPASGWRHHDHAQTSNRRPSQRSRSQAEEPRSPFSLDEETVGKPILKGTDECSKPHKNDALLVQTKSVSSSSAEKPDRLLKSQEATSAIDTGKEESISFDCPASSLEDLQRRQSEIEEENKRKKALLEKAVQERYLQSQAEVKKLHVVKEELNKLDFLVTRDVSILRDKIEEANQEYNSARQRFEKAEREYIESKVQLYRASEVKELLSEHLCAVIQHNEARKSTKLEELMSKLQMDRSTSKEHGEGAEADNRSLTDVGALLKTPTPGMDVWPALTKKQRHCSTTNRSNTLIQSDKIRNVPLHLNENVHGNQCTAGTVTDEERNGQKEAKAETSTSEPQIMVAATGTSILTNHSNGETPVSTSSCSSSDITLAAPRMD